ncbi:Glutamate synthase (ferredoxin) [Melioribacter roseus P3M-2]|uniref:Glutamate synthase [NADPH] large chain n=1 Tax=Melioribacter roseus (strain DSM 23840 / JCM 17771 / VKM B-2668 / P3M-2) TaxID=1191523 RepID=I6Z4A6_MELRP|nr:glutamate synthase large subunit [Melioribacter roseus]AFN73955.1 Glutamate synthase (ferredoxin) [Melioribacter roseus P3M-2]
MGNNYLYSADGRLKKNALYDPKFERDNCGVGFIAKLDGIPTHKVVEDAINILVNLEHRGALGGDKSTGDGAGIMIDIPDRFFQDEAPSAGIKLPAYEDYAVGMVFLPADNVLADKCKKIFEKYVLEEGCDMLGWRDVPVDSSAIGQLAKSTEPRVVQIFIHRGKINKEAFERKLYVIRRQVEKEVDALPEDTSQFYVTSLSSSRLVYKGLLTANQLPRYYPDLSDERFQSKFGVVHQRYSTNTQPTWNLAQPFRFLAHNGEINTLSGNINRMKAREFTLKSELFGDDIEKIKPIIVESGSDSAIFDNVLELLVMGGRSIPHAMMMMVPEAYGPKIQMSEDKRAFYDFHSAIMEPWDGPAAIVFTDSRFLGGILDRNGLRPARYSITKDGMVVLASESGVVEFPPEKIIKRSRLSPGKMLLADFKQNRVVPDKEIKAKISRQKPYRRWIKDNIITLRGLFTPASAPEVENEESLLRKQHVFGYTEEELKLIITPMASRSQEPVGSMGNDTPLAILSNRPNLLFYYFKQRFAQVTNPAIDPLREELVMSLESFVGGEGNLLEESPENFRGFKFPHPVLTPEDLKKIEHANHPNIKVSYIDILFDKKGGDKALENELNNIFEAAAEKIKNGSTVIVLTDKNVDENRAPIPSLLAASGLHHYLIRNGLRTKTSIIVESGEVREVMNFALLISYGVDAICPYLALNTVRYLAENNFLEQKLKPEEAIDSYIIAVKKGLLKTMSRLGISTLHSYFAAQTFEAIGLSKDLVEKYFTGTINRLGGIDLDDIQKEAIIRHSAGFPEKGNPENLLSAGGEYSIRLNGEKHFWNHDSISKLQLATRTDDYEVFKEFTRIVNEGENSPVAIRKMLRFKKRNPIPIDEVEPVESIVKRFVVSAMSFGSISKEAHETIAIAVNRIGARSNSGEGGEDMARNKVDANGDTARSKVKQVASGRFGVTPEYLLSAEELQIKIAQGAKPGEGGQLPGHKVTPEIARVRHTTPGVTLISPPPHHDIYSIEDLAQLIYDLKCINPDAKVSVKLVSESGVGTVASGVAKAKADIVLISGYEGGTGASPLTSIKHTGIPWEIGLAETHQTLIHNKLRDKIRVQVDGQIKTGRDLAIATLLGAEEYGFATSVLITIGCVMLRKCHQNTCSVGVATQDPTLRARFSGKPEYIERFFRFLAQDFREVMAELGFRTVDEMVGHTELLEFSPPPDLWKAQKFDLRPLLDSMVDTAGKCCMVNMPNQVEVYDEEFIDKLKPAIEEKKPVELDLPIRNIHRTVGARMSGYVVKKHGSKGLPEDTIKINFKGSAGQSFGAFLSPGITFKLEGDVNDYMGKGMAGGRIVVVPPANAGFAPHDNVICGNVALYGATGGEVFINGKAGERFAIRNSGASAVVEGIGDHGCEYMTGGTVVCIGSTGKNFAAGMSGGIAFIYDETQLFDTKCNLDMVDLESVWDKNDKLFLRTMIEKHYYFTNSPRAKMILERWESSLPLFVKVIPIEYRKVLERMKLSEHADVETVAATEEVYDG